ncbi:response regulator transcription factor [Mesosutterella sp. OilRF-GAM-744-9]|uniref:Response regulator transcription factor n=1 Tax=Mesosutterella porci TaxID=2915351 RepID=A0ABS9MNQ3_9BURK|nr:response regulator transcription factor [Mesosutterella sp. oilRF-744-WT-GAM-9]MCG5030251.1 response regulator transcription factor [Mesosutterella sp. oilRF-744-WT-GAM-9]MCI6530303.1 response regulator transcription factor [Mesosutterella sp.]
MPENKINVLLVEDDGEVRHRFETTINQDPLMRVVGCASTKRDAARLIETLKFEVMVIDLGLPDGDGIDLIHLASRLHPSSDIMVITVYGDEQHVVNSIAAGATGYILKEAESEDITAQIKLLRGGGSPVSPSVARSVLRALQSHSGGIVQSSEPNPLSARETEILHLLAKGMSFNEIGEILSISPHTVTAHIKKIYRKLQVHSRGEAVYEAGQMGLLNS